MEGVRGGRAGGGEASHALVWGGAGARELSVEDLKREEDGIRENYSASQNANVNACDEKLKLAEEEVVRAGGVSEDSENALLRYSVCLLYYHASPPCRGGSGARGGGDSVVNAENQGRRSRQE
jgi:hypothetical protein